MNNHGCSKPELMSIIGMFVNALPIRYQINSNHSFHEFVKHVQTIATQTFEYSYFPLQRILAQHPHISRPTFLDVFFGFVSLLTEDNYDETKFFLSNLLYKNSNNSIREIIDQLISHSSSVLKQYQGDELIIVGGSILIQSILVYYQQIFEQSSSTLQWTKFFHKLL
ncbi:unnamed protein product [Adineta steineri]|uniref:Condensation domain-containing protein n=1 Tax=Adineta steineri TaxID=433720 RepID=A0A814PCS8_9BILA|nr:unnamed protein product [Adineta steineri]CAF4214464.1 unnamed protein product [Adineta steineri]